MTEVRRKNKAFHKDMIAKLQKMHGKYSIRDQEDTIGPEDTQLGETREDINKEIIYIPPFLARISDKRTSLPTYEPTHSVGAKVVL